MFDKVGEWHSRGVGVIDVSSHDEGKCSYFGRPQDIRVAGGFRATLHDTVMKGAEFVHMVALVRTAAGIQERKQSSDEQARLVHTHRIGSGKDGAGFTVFALTVAEKQRVVSREEVGEVTGLPDETARHDYTVAHVGSRTDDKVFGRYVGAYVNRGFPVAVDGAVFEARSSVDTAAVAYAHIAHGAGVDHVYTVAYFATVAFYGSGIVGNHLFEPFGQVGTMAIHGDDIGQLSR